MRRGPGHLSGTWHRAVEAAGTDDGDPAPVPRVFPARTRHKTHGLGLLRRPFAQRARPDLQRVLEASCRIMTNVTFAGLLLDFSALLHIMLDVLMSLSQYAKYTPESIQD